MLGSISEAASLKTLVAVVRAAPQDSYNLDLLLCIAFSFDPDYKSPKFL